MPRTQRSFAPEDRLSIVQGAEREGYVECNAEDEGDSPEKGTR